MSIVHAALLKWFSGEQVSLIYGALAQSGHVIVPREATETMARYAKHRNPEVSVNLANGVWCCMVDEATKPPATAASE